MKPNFYHFLGFSIILLTLVFFSANAQEEAPTNEMTDLNYYPDLQEEKSLLSDPTSNSIEKTSSLSKEQLIAVPKSGKSKSGEGSKLPLSEPEDDALSFNFLYYIIQKFKISDIVEQ
jgi:hypothetical protein